MAVVIEFTADERKAVAKIAKLEARIVGLEQKTRGLGAAGAGAGKKMDKAFGAGALSRMKSYALMLAGPAGVFAALRLISNEYRTQIELQKQAAGKQITVAGAQRDLMLNLFGADPVLKERMRSSAGAISQKTKVPREFVFQALSSAISSQPDVTEEFVENTIRAVAQAALVTPHRPEQLGQVAGALVSMSKITGSADPLLNQGFMQAVGAASQVVDFQKQVQHIPKALIGVKGFGATASEAGSLFAAVSTAMDDRMGRMAGTASIQFAKQLQEFFTGDRASTPGKAMREMLQRNPYLDLPTLPKSFTGRVEFLRQHPGLAQSFVDTSSFETKARAPLKGLVGLVTEDERLAYRREHPGAAAMPAALTYRTFQAGMRGRFSSNLEGFAREAQKTIDEFATLGGSVEVTATVGRALAQSVEQFQLAGGVRARAGAIRENLGEVLKLSGRSGLGTGISLIGFDAAVAIGQKDPLAIAAGILRARRRQLLGGDAIVGPQTGDATAEQREDAARLLVAIEALNSQLEQIKQNTAKGAERSGGGTTLGRVDDDPGAGQ